MTRSVTVAGVPRAGANSKPHHYKQKRQKMMDLPKTWVSMGKPFEDFRRKKELKIYYQSFKKTQWNTRTLNALNEQGPRKQLDLY